MSETIHSPAGAPPLARGQGRPATLERPDVAAPLAAALSFLFPGLGQFFNGQFGWGAALALPLMPLIGATVVLLVNANVLVAYLFHVPFLVAVVGLNIGLLLWRLTAILQAHLGRSQLELSRLSTYATIALAVLAIGMHALPAWYGVQAISTLNAVALGGDGGGQLIRDAFGEVRDPSGLLPTPAPRASGAPDPTPQPPVPAGERINILLVGVDALPSRQSILTDTMLLVSLNPRTGETAMISVPRDIYGAPLRGGGTFDAKLNSLMAVGGVETLKGAISELLGVPIHHFAAMNLLGFKSAVDAIGGVDVYVERAVNDPHYYDEYDQHTGFYIQPGWHHLDGRTALAFVRSRQGAGDSDFTRAARQQQVLTAIREKLTAGNLLTSLPGLMQVAQDTVATDIPGDGIARLAETIEEADMSRLSQHVLTPPDYVTSAVGPGGQYILIPNVPAIRALGQELLGD